MRIRVEAYDVVGRRRELTIGAHRHKVGAGVQVAVEDAGVGFEQVSIERLFQALYTTKPDGLGMGPSIAAQSSCPMGGAWGRRRTPVTEQLFSSFWPRRKVTGYERR